MSVFHVSSRASRLSAGFWVIPMCPITAEKVAGQKLASEMSLTSGPAQQERPALQTDGAGPSIGRDGRTGPSIGKDGRHRRASLLAKKQGPQGLWACPSFLGPHRGDLECQARGLCTCFAIGQFRPVLAEQTMFPT